MEKFNDLELCVWIEYELESGEMGNLPILDKMQSLKRGLDICNKMTAEEKIGRRKETHKELVERLQRLETGIPEQDSYGKLYRLVIEYFCLSDEAVEAYDKYSETGVGVSWVIYSDAYGLNDLYITDSEHFKSRNDDRV